MEGWGVLWDGRVCAYDWRETAAGIRLYAPWGVTLGSPGSPRDFSAKALGSEYPSHRRLRLRVQLRLCIES